MRHLSLFLVSLFMLCGITTSRAESLHLVYQDSSAVTQSELSQVPEEFMLADVVSVGEVSGLRYVTPVLIGASAPSWIGGVWEITIVLFKQPITTSDGATFLWYWNDRIFPNGGEQRPYLVYYSLTEPDTPIGSKVVFVALVGTVRPVLWGAAYILPTSQ